MSKSNDRSSRYTPESCAYDPWADLHQRHPEWAVETCTSSRGEVVDVLDRVVQIDPSYRGEQYAVAHAIAHLDLGHVDPRGGGEFTRRQEEDAHWLAEMRLDDETLWDAA